MQLDILGNWAQELKLIHKPLAYFSGKKSGPAGILAEHLSGSPYAATSFGEFMAEETPIPFAMQAFLTSVWNTVIPPDEEKRGRPQNITLGTLQSMLEFVGLQTTFRSGNDTRATLGDLLQAEATLFEYLTSSKASGDPSIIHKGVGLGIDVLRELLPQGEPTKPKSSPADWM